MKAEEMTVRQLTELAQDYNVIDFQDMNLEELISAIMKAQEEENLEIERTRTNGRVRNIEVWKDGIKIKTINGLIKTLKWAVAEGICNEGWVKHSLRTGKETVAGRKFKTGGYLFKYAD